MRRSILYLLPLLLLALFMGCEKSAQDGYRVRGSIAGADGNQPVKAHAHLGELNGSMRRPLQSVEVDPSGNFALDIAEPGLYRLWVTATDHEPLDIPFAVELEDAEIKLGIKMKAHDYKTDLSEVKIIGTWNDFKRADVNAMIPQDDGTFLFETTVKNDSVKYQLLGITEVSRSTNGTESQFFEYDGGGDYYSGILAENGQVRIVFDPSRLLRSSSEVEVTFDDRHRDLGKLREIEVGMSEAFADYRKAYNAYADSHGNAAGFEYDFADLRSYLDEKMKSGQELIGQYAAIQYTRLYWFDYHLSQATYDAILQTVPANSPLWSIGLSAIASGMGLLDAAKTREALNDIYTANADSSIKARALISLAELAQIEGDEEGYAAAYAEFEVNYGNNGIADYKMAILDPESNIAWGKPVPEFEVRLLGSDKTITNQTFLGRYYLIDFWATWCNPCVAEMPYLHEAYENYMDQNFTIVSLTLDSEPEAVDTFRSNRWEMPWVHAFVDDGWNSEIVASFNVNKTGIPSAFLVSPEGKIVATHHGLRGEYLGRTLSQYFGSN